MRSGAGSALLTAVVLLGGCATTSPDRSGYLEQASLTLGTAASEVATIRLFLSERDDADVWAAAVDTQLRYSEDGVASASQSFGALDPPPGTDRLEKHCRSLLDDAESLLADVRIALHRDNTRKYPVLVADLEKLGKRLESLESRVSS